jgi:hypothetical protein
MEFARQRSGSGRSQSSRGQLLFSGKTSINAHLPRLGWVLNVRAARHLIWSLYSPSGCVDAG